MMSVILKMSCFLVTSSLTSFSEMQYLGSLSCISPENWKSKTSLSYRSNWCTKIRTDNNRSNWCTKIHTDNNRSNWCTKIHTDYCFNPRFQEMWCQLANIQTYRCHVTSRKCPATFVKFCRTGNQNKPQKTTVYRIVKLSSIEGSVQILFKVISCNFLGGKKKVAKVISWRPSAVRPWVMEYTALVECKDDKLIRAGIDALGADNSL